jgi:hypothetical protein
MQTPEAGTHVPLLESQSKQHFSAALHRHFVALPSMPVLVQALPLALLAAVASPPMGALSARANTHPNAINQRVISFPPRFIPHSIQHISDPSCFQSS